MPTPKIWKVGDILMSQPILFLDFIHFFDVITIYITYKNYLLYLQF